MLRIHLFSTHYTELYEQKTAEKAFLLSIKLLRKIQNVWLLKHVPQLYQFKSGCLCHLITVYQVLCSISLPALQTLWATFQAKNNVRSTSASIALAQVSHRSHNTHTANRHLRSSGERNGAQRRTKVTIGRTMMQTLKLLRLVKRHILGWSDVKQSKNQAHSLNGYQVMLVWRH